MTSRSAKKFSRAILLALLAATALLIAHSSRLVRSSFAEQADSEPKKPIYDHLSKAEISDGYGKLPLNFEVNKGQTDPQVKFLSRGPGYGLFLTSGGMVLTLQEPKSPDVDKFRAPASVGDASSTSAQQLPVLRLTMIGANPKTRVEGQDELPGKVNYLVGNDQEKWHTNIPTYLKVHYAEIYPKVDLIYYGNRTELEYDFVVAPGGNLQSIKFQIEGTDRILLDHTGDLLLHVKKREVRLRKPVIYQLTDKDDRREVKGDYVLKGSEIGFRVKSYDSSKPLIIDPVLSYSTLLGSGSNEFGYGIAVDSQGNAYITGEASSISFPTTPGAFQTGSFGGAFITKLNSAGTDLVYSTYLSGSNGATGTAIEVDLSGNAYVTGSTSSSDFPSVNAIRTSHNFLQSADSGASWTGKNLSPPRNITSLAIDPQFPSTMYAGTNGGTGVYKSIDNGNSWIALTTGFSSASVADLVIDPITPSTVYAATNTPSFGVIKTENGGTSWTAVNNGLSTGGIYRLAIDPVSPSTLYLGSNGGLFKTTNGGNNWTASNNGLSTTAFTIAIDPTTPSTIYAGSGVIFKSTNGGANWTTSSTGLSGFIHSIVIDPTNTAIIYAGTSSGSSGVFKSINGGGNWTSAGSGLGNAPIYSFALSPDNSTTIYAGSGNGKIFKTLDGGNNWSTSYASFASLAVLTLVVDPSAPSNVYAGTYANFNSFDSEAFLAKLNATGSALIYSTYLGGSSNDYGYGIAIDSVGNAYVTGQTTSSDFLTASPFQAARGGDGDAFLAKINPSGSTLLYSTYLGGVGFDTGYDVAADASGNAYVTGTTYSTNFPTANAFQSTNASLFGGDAFATKFGSNGTLAYSTYLGGNASDTGYGIAVDPAGNAYITGQTGSTNFPTLNPIQPTYGGSGADAFVTKLNNLGSGLVYSTYLGGSNLDSGRGIAVDSASNAYVTGFTGSVGFPVVAGALGTKSPFFASSDGGTTWKNDNYGLKSDIVTTLTWVPTIPSAIFAGTRTGVYKSADGGRNWNSSSNGLVSPNVVGLVVDPLSPSTIYLGTSSGGVFKSTNGGNTWNGVNNGLGNGGVSCLAIDPVTPATLYAVSASRIFKTSNGGSSWTAVGPSPFFVTAIVIDPTSPTTIYAAAVGVFKSVDGGATWQNLSTGLTTTIQSLALDPVTPSTIYAGGTGGLFKSLNAATSWTSINTGLSGLNINAAISAIAIDPVTPTTLYVASSSFNGSIFKSVNGGNNWSPIKGLRYPSVSSLLVNPVVPSRVYAGVNIFPSDEDAFVAKLNPSGSALIYSTLLGGSGADFSFADNNDEGFGIAVDSAGNAYVAGLSRSLDFPVSSDAYQPFNRGFTDVFVSKLTMSYIISGQVLDGNNAPVSGAEVTLSDGTSLSWIITDSDGSYEFSHLREGGNFTVSAAKPHFTMSPPSQTFNTLNSNQTLNFVASATNAPFYTLSGQVTNNGPGLSSVTVTLSGSQAGIRTTDSNGNYSFTLAAGGDYTVTPAMLGFSFSPSSRTFNSLGSDQTADFTSTRQSFVVTNANDHGAGSLRQAILDANATTGLDTIVFNIPGAGVQTINLLIGLPSITDPVVIDATTQPGYAGTPLVELNGEQTNDSAGFVITAGGSTIRGFAIGKFTSGRGIWLNGSGNNVVQGNYIGLDSTGTVRRNNGDGILISNSSNNLIGGTTLLARNIISGNSSDGVAITGSGNQIQGNFIGTNAAGTAAIGNGSNGVEISGSSQLTDNIVGGTSAGAGNLISGNQKGINCGVPGNIFQGNLIGTNLAGTAAIANNTGIQSSGSNTLIGGTVPGARNLISGNRSGVIVSGPQSRLQGNFIGTDITGTIALGNVLGGVFAGDQALIGGTTPEARNVISGNGGTAGFSNSGNVVMGYNNIGESVTVQGNYIGTDVTGNAALVNPSFGITFLGSHHLIGGLAVGARNIISGNVVGVLIGGSGIVTANVVQGNFIGLNAGGNAPLPNQSDGVRLYDGNGNTIGGVGADAGNRIAFNGGSGVLLLGGTGNSIYQNSIFSNAGLGVDLTPTGVAGPNGVTANDVGDADPGSNNLQNFPLLTSVVSNGGGTLIQGTLNSTPNATFRIDFYSNAACDPSGNGEGASFFDTTSGTTDANGNATINLASPMTLASGRVITATATDPSGNTSEFSPCDSTNTIGTLQFSNASYKVLEEVGNAIITVIRSGGSKGSFSVNYSTADVTALAGSDYTAVSGTLVFADGETSQTFTIPIANDGISEPDETVRLTLTGITDLETVGNPTTATMTIQDNSTPLVLTMNSIDVPEGNSGTTNVVVTVSLSAQTLRTVTADFTTVGVTATSGVDFEAVAGSLTFAAGITTQTISVSVIGDILNEVNETFRVVLSNPTNATIGNFSTARILDDDPLRIDSVTPPAGRGSCCPQIQLTGAFARLSMVQIGGIYASWFFTNGTANTSAITVSIPTPHTVGAVQIDLTPTSGSPYSKANAFAYLPTVFTDNTITVGQTTAKGQHIIELRQAVDALRAVAGLSPAPWTDATLTPSSSIIKAIHILELRNYLDDAAGRLGYATSPYTDPTLGSGFPIKRVHIEELRQRIRNIAG